MKITSTEALIKDFKDLLETPAGNFSNKKRFLIDYFSQALTQREDEIRKETIEDLLSSEIMKNLLLNVSPKTAKEYREAFLRLSQGGTIYKCPVCGLEYKYKKAMLKCNHDTEEIII